MSATLIPDSGVQRAKPQPEPRLVPPEETTWSKYSSNGEPILSGLSSFLLHAAVLGIIVMGAWSMFGKSNEKAVVELIPFTEEDGPLGLGGGGGDPNGVKNGGPGDLKPPSDAVHPLVEPRTGTPNAKLDEPQVKPSTPAEGNDPLGEAIQKKLERLPNIPQLRREFDDRVEGIKSHGKRGPGRNGGDGTGDGPGTGAESGVRNPRKPSSVIPRVLRWELVFTTNDAKHYLQQLDALGAIVAIPDTKGRLMTIRDLKARPAKPEYEDVKALNRIFWVDERKETTESFAKELDLDITPSALVAFFPENIEKELLDKELAYAKRKEEDIESTRFAVSFAAGRHVFKVTEQKPKAGKK